MKYEINPKKIFKLTAIPFEVNEYISEVSGENLKVLFLIFSEKNFLSSFDIATKLELSVSQVEDAIRYWKFKGVLKAPEEEKAVFEVKKPSADQISAQELKKAKEENELIAMLFKESEILYARPLRPMERRHFLYIFESLGLPIDVILMVIDFCIRNSKSLRQIISICENMSDVGVNSHEQAEEYIKGLTQKYDLEDKVKHCFGIYNRNLTKNEQNYINRWATKYGYNINIIRAAFSRCVDSTGKLSFPYIEKILQNWKKNSVKTPQDIEKLDINKKSLQKKNTKKTSYDLDKLLAKNPLYIPE